MLKESKMLLSSKGLFMFSVILVSRLFSQSCVLAISKADNTAPTSKNTPVSNDEEVASIFNLGGKQDVIVQPKWTSKGSSNSEQSDVIVTPWKLKETSDIRKEIKDAVSEDKYFVKSQQNTSISNVGEGLIVQPEWTVNDNKKNQNEQPQVIITEQKLVETAQIREEIKEAIKDDTYAIGTPNESEMVKELDDFFHHKSRARQFLSNLLGSSSDDVDNDDEGMVNYDSESKNNRRLNDKSDSEITPNIINSKIYEDDSTDNIHISDHVFDESSSKFTNREQLRLKIIRELDLNFTLGVNISEWKVIDDNYDTILIGFVDNVIIFLSKENNFEQIGEVKFDENIVGVEFFTQWNSTTKMFEQIMLIATKSFVNILRLKDQEFITKWSIGSQVTGIRFYSLKDSKFLAVITYNNVAASLNIYEFDLSTQDLWIIQKIPLQNACSEIVFLNTGRDIVLAIPQIDSVTIFTYNPDLQYKSHFEHVFRVESADVSSISGFQMGGFSYLAIGGRQPQILRYHRGHFIPQAIFGQSFQIIDRYLPIPIRTFRDDLILLVQHTINFDTHSLLVLESLIWDGSSFETSPSSPCIIGNTTFESGVSCMLHVDSDDGIRGAAAFSDGNEISVILPRSNASSTIFKIETELIEQTTEILKLERIQRYLEHLIKDQKNIVLEAENFLQKSQNLESNHFNKVNITGKIDKIYLNDQEWTDEDSNVDINELLDILGEIKQKIDGLELSKLDPENSLNETKLNSRVERENIENIVEVDDLDVEDLFLENLNGIPLKWSYTDGKLFYDGVVIIENDLEVEEFENENMMQAKSLTDEEQDSEIEAFTIDSNLELDTINGMPWTDFINGIIMTNNNVELEQLNVDGALIIENVIDVKSINNINFPDGFLLSSGPSTSIISGKKTFHGNLVADAIDTNGLINGVNPFDIITLSDDQSVPGLTKFLQLEVTESLEINGTVSRGETDEFIPNPNLLQTNTVDSACTFNTLEVKGPVIVYENLNREDFDKRFDDVVYKTENTVVINSSKIFKTAVFENELNIENAQINNIPVYDYVTKSTAQELEISQLFGNVYINDLTIQGLFDTVNITQLYENALRVDQNQYFNSELILTDSMPPGSLKTLKVLQNLNGNAVENFKTIHDDLKLNHITLNSFSAETLTANCDLNGDGTFNEINLKHFDKVRLSKSLSQTIPGSVEVEELVLEQDVTIEALNGISSDFLLTFLDKLDNIPLMIQLGSIKVDHFTVSGDIHVNTLNGRHFDDDIQTNVIWLNRPNFIQTEINFVDPFRILGNLTINRFLNGVHFEDFLSDVIFKFDEITTSGTKKFLSPIQILDDAQINSINNIPMSDIVSKNSPHIFENSFYINGDLEVENLEIRGFLNEHKTEEFQQIIRYDKHLDTYVLGKAYFQGETFIDDFIVYGNLSYFGNVEYFLNDLVYKNLPAILLGTKIFRNQIIFEDNLYINYFNGKNLPLLLDNIVLINNVEPVEILSPVVFIGPVSAASIAVIQKMKAVNVMGCDIHRWLSDTLRTDLPLDIEQPLNFASESLEGASLNAAFLNGKSMNDIITLHTAQNITSHVHFSAVYLTDSILSTGKINGVDLEEERKNTLMINGKQHITAPTTMQSFRVLRNLEIKGLVNDRDISTPLTLMGDVHIESPASFKQIIAKSAQSFDLISGIDFSSWHQNSLSNNALNYQLITGNWTAKYISIWGNMGGNGIFNGLSTNDLKLWPESIYPELESSLKNLNLDYYELCTRIDYILKNSKKRPYFLKHFKISLKLTEDGDVSKIIIFKQGSDIYLLSNIFCYSNIYRWNTINEIFEKINGMESGIVEQILYVPIESEDKVLLVTNSEHNMHDCKVYGTNAWEFHGDRIKFLGNFGEIGDYSAIHQSSESSDIFYGIDERNNMLARINLVTMSKKTWNLPSDNDNPFGFLPDETNLGIAISDGKRILIVNSPNENDSRYKRNDNVDQSENLNDSDESREVVSDISFLEVGHINSNITSIINDMINNLNSELIQIKNIENFVDEISPPIIKGYILNLQSNSAETFVENLNIINTPIPANIQIDITTLHAFAVIKILWNGLKHIERVHSINDDSAINSAFLNIKNIIINGMNDTIMVRIEEKPKISKKDQFEHIITRLTDQLLESVKILDNLALADITKPHLTTETEQINESSNRSTTIDSKYRQNHENIPKHDPYLENIPNNKNEPLKINLLATSSHSSDNITTTILEEPIIGQEISNRGLLIAENNIFPSRTSGEILVLKVGPAKMRQTLVAITDSIDHYVAGQHDVVKLFSDIQEGQIFQTINAFKPRSLTALHIRDETVLAFVENNYLVRIFVYRGVQGFTEFTKFQVDLPITILSSATIYESKGCPKNFLIASAGSVIQFYEAVMAGDCGINEELYCY